MPREDSHPLPGILDQEVLDEFHPAHPRQREIRQDQVGGRQGDRSERLGRRRSNAAYLTWAGTRTGQVDATSTLNLCVSAIHSTSQSSFAAMSASSPVSTGGHSSTVRVRVTFSA